MQPLYLDVVPAEHTAGVVAALVAAIHNQTDHINCGIIGSRFLLDVLTKHGHGDLALTLATTKTCPGWGYMVEQQKGDPHDTPGTLWETWQDGEKNAFFCAVLYYGSIYQDRLGTNTEKVEENWDVFCSPWHQRLQEPPGARRRHRAVALPARGHR